LWMDIGKPEEYLQTNKIILDTISVKRKRRRTSSFQLKEPVALDKDVSVADGAVIGPYAVLGKNVTVGKNTHIKDSVIFSGTNIGDSAWINGAIIGEEAEIGDHVKFGKGCIIADHAKITKGVSLTDDMAVCPAKVIS
jgi:NDP-sugar pyrophosphorylase family protein